MTNKDALRIQLRRLRQQLSDSQQIQASGDLAQQVIESGILDNCDSLAVYLANDGEIDPSAIVEVARQRKIPVYLPVLDESNSGHLKFHQWHISTKFARNKYGIPEPLGTQEINAGLLHTVFIPLVGFDDQGGRLGMGGGFYDRTFEQYNDTSIRLIGLAHECQKVASLQLEPWDIPMSKIITNKSRY